MWLVEIDRKLLLGIQEIVPRQLTSKSARLLLILACSSTYETRLAHETQCNDSMIQWLNDVDCNAANECVAATIFFVTGNKWFVKYICVLSQTIDYGKHTCRVSQKIVSFLGTCDRIKYCIITSKNASDKINHLLTLKRNSSIACWSWCACSGDDWCVLTMQPCRLT